MSAVERALVVLQDAIRDERDERACPLDTDDLNARLNAYKWAQERTPRTPASPMPHSASGRSRHSAPPQALASPFRHSAMSVPQTPATQASGLRRAETLGPHDSISVVNVRGGGTDRDGEDRPRSRAITPRPRSRSVSRERPSDTSDTSDTRSPYNKFVERPQSPTTTSSPAGVETYTDEADHSPHGLQYPYDTSPLYLANDRSMKAHRAALIAAQREKEARAEDEQEDREAAAAKAEQVRGALRLAETTYRLKEAEGALRTLQAKLVAEKLRTGEVERRAAETAAKREADRRELAVTVSILRRAKDDSRRGEEERRRLLRAFEETKGRLVKYHAEIRVRDARKVAHEEGRTEAFAEAGRWMGPNPPLPVGELTTAPVGKPTTAPRGAVSQPNDFSLSPLGVRVDQLPSIGSAAQQFQQHVGAIPQGQQKSQPQPQTQRAAPPQARQPQANKKPQQQRLQQPQPQQQQLRQPQSQPQQPQDLFQQQQVQQQVPQPLQQQFTQLPPTVQLMPQPSAATYQQPPVVLIVPPLPTSLGPQAALGNLATSVPLNLVPPGPLIMQGAPTQPPILIQPPHAGPAMAPQVCPAFANVPAPSLPVPALRPVPVPVPLHPQRSHRSVASLDERGPPFDSRMSQYSGMPPRQVAESFIDRVQGTPARPVTRAPSHLSRAAPTVRSNRSVMEVNKPLPELRHTQSLSQPTDLTSAAVMGHQGGPHRDSKYPAWDGPDPSFDNPGVMAMKAFQERASLATRSYRSGSDDLAAAAAVQLPSSESDYSAAQSRPAPSRLGDVMRDDLSRISEESPTPARSVREAARTPARSPRPIPALGISIGGAAPELSDPMYHRAPTITVQPPSSTRTPLESRRPSGAPTRAPSPGPSPVPRNRVPSRAPSPSPMARTRGPSPTPRRETVYAPSVPVAPSMYANSVAHAAAVALPRSQGTAYSTVPPPNSHPRPRTPAATYTSATKYRHDRSAATPRSYRTAIETLSDEDGPRPRSILKNRGETPLIDPYCVPLPPSRTNTYAPSASTAGIARRVPLPPSAGTRSSWR
ncbi:hypothetical protein CspHIS471_0307710 [Cutaneotrichosporon sp. HIS471]|nr:hypothetical protein CspHIS471_0307710 [Cutaneotrichosporon sp. HIS471]